VNLAFPGREDVPGALAHRMTVSSGSARPPLPERVTARVAPTTVSKEDPVVVGPPLRGDGWIAAASCCDSYHRRALLPIDGRRFLAQRFAIDWIRIDAERRLGAGDASRNESFPQFGEDVLAVADGSIVHVVDGVPDNVPGSFPSDTSITNADGNSVVQDLGGGSFALYAHLQPGSIRVRPGERVRRGQVLGLLGNSGNSDGPHLHFHVMDGPSALASNGLPYAIDAFTLVGEAVSQDDLQTEFRSPNQPIQVRPVTGAAKQTGVLPADLAIVRFPD
jgi:hypothetical protein